MLKSCMLPISCSHTHSTPERLYCTFENTFKRKGNTANLPTNIMDLRGFHSSIILILRSGALRPTGDFPDSLSQAILAGIMLRPVRLLRVWISEGLTQANS